MFGLSGVSVLESEFAGARMKVGGISRIVLARRAVWVIIKEIIIVICFKYLKPIVTFSATCCAKTMGIP